MERQRTAPGLVVHHVGDVPRQLAVGHVVDRRAEGGDEALLLGSVDVLVPEHEQVELVVAPLQLERDRGRERLPGVDPDDLCPECAAERTNVHEPTMLHPAA